MTMDFINRIIRNRIIDTAKYRYIAVECNDADKQWLEIRRLQLSQLDTTAAIDGWTTVKRIY